MSPISGRALFILLLAALLAGCGATTTPPESSPAPVGPVEESPVDGVSPQGYPVPTLSSPVPGAAYPPPIVTPTRDPNLPYPPPDPVGVVAVAFDEPLNGGATEVTGEGLPGLPISIISVSRNGELLGSGRIGGDGRFSISVPPLEAGTVIGAQHGDLAGSGYGPEDLVNCAGCRDIPLIGLLLGQAVVN